MVVELDEKEWDRVQQLIQQQAERIAQLEEKVARLKKLLEGRADAKGAKKPRFTENDSLGRNQRNKPKKQRKKSTGRRTHEVKRELATLEVDVYRDDATREDCIRHRSQLVWRMIDGKGVYVCYHICDVPESQYLPLPPAVRNSRCEFGMEIILIRAFSHYWIGVSLDHACQIMEFFTGLKLPKPQADSLLNRLGPAVRHDCRTDCFAVDRLHRRNRLGNRQKVVLYVGFLHRDARAVSVRRESEKGRSGCRVGRLLRGHWRHGRLGGLQEFVQRLSKNAGISHLHL